MPDHILYENYCPQFHDVQHEQENNFLQSQETTQEINYVSCYASEYCGNHYIDPIFLNENGFCKVCSDALQNYYIHLQNTNSYHPRNIYDPYQQNVYDQNYQRQIQTSHIHQQFDQGLDQNYLFNNNAISNWIEKLVDTNAALTLLALSKKKSYSCKNCKNGSSNCKKCKS
jgi:hypothetical protein